MNTQAEPSGGAATSTLEQRLGRLEGQVGALIEAVEELVIGFEDAPVGAERSEAGKQRAARRAHELLLLVKAARHESPGA
jgi:hypothetical protein